MGDVIAIVDGLLDSHHERLGLDNAMDEHAADRVAQMGRE